MCQNDECGFHHNHIAGDGVSEGRAAKERGSTPFAHVIANDIQQHWRERHISKRSEPNKGTTWGSDLFELCRSDFNEG